MLISILHLLLFSTINGDCVTATTEQYNSAIEYVRATKDFKRYLKRAKTKEVHISPEIIPFDRIGLFGSDFEKLSNHPFELSKEKCKETFKDKKIENFKSNTQSDVLLNFSDLRSRILIISLKTKFIDSDSYGDQMFGEQLILSIFFNEDGTISEHKASKYYLN